MELRMKRGNRSLFFRFFTWKSVEATRAKEEQLSEQQRILTQLKRKLRMALKEGLGQGKLTKPKLETIEYEKKLDFTLQTPAVKVNEVNAWKSSQDSEQVASSGSS